MMQNQELKKTEAIKNLCVLITLSGGLIDQVEFYSEPKLAVMVLSDFVKEMNPEDQDAAVYNQTGLIANAKSFLDENDEYFFNAEFFNFSG